jgi:ABC-type nitrate/sulfonate/bicarbonate transport system substrate-binding protein
VSTAYSRRSFLRQGLLTVGGIAATGALGEVLTACGSSSSSSSGGGSMPSVGVQLSWIKNVEFAGSYIADNKGYYQQAGVGVNLIAGGPTASIEPTVVSGKALVGINTPDSTATAVDQGAPLKIIASMYQKSPFALMSLASKPINTPQDLYGKKIGVQATNEPIWNTFLKANNLDASKITKVPVQFDPTPLAQGQVDGWVSYITNEPNELKVKGVATKTFLFNDYNYPVFTNTYFVTEQTLADKKARANVVNFLRADVRGWQDSIKDAKLGAQLTVDNYGKNLGLDVAEQTLESQAANQLIQSADTSAHGLFWMTDERIAQTVQTVALGGTKITPALFTREILDEVFQGKTTV